MSQLQRKFKGKIKSLEEHLEGRTPSIKQKQKLAKWRAEIKRLGESAGQGVNWLGRQTALSLNRHAAELKKKYEAPG